VAGAAGTAAAGAGGSGLAAARKRALARAFRTGARASRRTHMPRLLQGSAFCARYADVHEAEQALVTF
jgi:hypothetical protein